ncbi:DUF3574 domain-containing protein [Streptomyces sp. ODS28]|uniref:DUF3574 domain-containing protein n=1 Tax=Streptomyces sp. ODS28 TaxID=3136688 RepID=UPI0031E74AEB
MPSRKTRSRLVATAAALAVVTGTPTAYAALDSDRGPAAQPASSSGAARGKPYIDTHLYFGTGRPGGQPPVSDKEFLSFVDKHVTPRFPSGLTIHQGRGQWRNEQGRITRERSYELNVLYPVSEARAHDADIEQIRKEYKHAYDQESVLRTDDREQADF